MLIYIYIYVYTYISLILLVVYDIVYMYITSCGCFCLCLPDSGGAWINSSRDAQGQSDSEGVLHPMYWDHWYQQWQWSHHLHDANQDKMIVTIASSVASRNSPRGHAVRLHKIRDVSLSNQGSLNPSLSPRDSICLYFLTVLNHLIPQKLRSRSF